MQQHASAPLSPVRRGSASSDVYSISNPPSSPCPSISGSELSFASDTESSATDYITTPPTSPTRAQQQFKHMLGGAKEDGSSSPTLESVLAALKVGDKHSSGILSAASSSLPKVSSPFATFPPHSAAMTPLRSRPGLAQSLSAKRPRASPGTIDLSSLPRFPTSTGGTPSAAGALTPQASSPNASTPKAGPDRPGLLSRWSTDSETSEGEEDGEGSESSCTSNDCEMCMGAEEREQEAGEEADGEGEFQALPARKGTSSPRNYFSRPSPSPQASRGYNPFFLSPSAAFEQGPILSPLPVSANSPSLLPPAPKPHQHGFSPFVEEPRPLASSSSAMSPSISTSSVVTVSASSSSDSSKSKKKSKRSHHQHHHHRGSHQPFVAQGNASPTSSDSPSPSTGDAPPSILPDPKNRLTRSQGLRIRDEGSRPKGRYARSLSLQLQSPISGNNGGDSSSTMKTANALLGGTISPAASTTDPLRVKLREMPGAVTPDGISSLPPSPSPANAPHQMPTINRSLSWLSGSGSSNGGRTPSSPLHISTLPGDEERNAKDTRTDLFSKSFSVASRPAAGPRKISAAALTSPRSGMSAIPEQKEQEKRKVEKDNPYFAGHI